MAARTTARKAAPRKRMDWYRKGLVDARRYWAAMAAGGSEREDNHIFGYLKVLADLPEEERPGNSTADHYLQGLAEGFQERIDDLLYRAAVLDSLGKVARALGKRPNKAALLKRDVRKEAAHG